MTAALGPSIGAELLDQLGFLHVPGRPFADGRAYLFVALRARPTLRHYDPERVEYWTFEEGLGLRAELDFVALAGPRSTHAWGPIRMVDRLRVANDYVSFGGDLSVGRIDGMRVLVFSSDAAILARGGHSQGWDPGAEEAAAFFARLRAMVGRDQSLERRVSQLVPVAVYSAFVASSLARYRATERLAAWRPQTLAMLRREQARLRAEAHDAWQAGSVLAGSLREQLIVGRARRA